MPPAYQHRAGSLQAEDRCQIGQSRHAPLAWRKTRRPEDCITVQRTGRDLDHKNPLRFLLQSPLTKIPQTYLHLLIFIYGRASPARICAAPSLFRTPPCPPAPLPPTFPSLTGGGAMTATLCPTI